MLNMMLLHWKEFGDVNAASVKECFEEKPYDGIERIISYLENGRIHLSAMRDSTDPFSGKVVSRESYIRDDGEYSWSNMLSYFAKEYHMRLPKEFENKILMK